MKQIYRALVVIALLAMTGPAWTLGLGKLEQDSSLNERFEGRIPLLSASAEELSSLKVRLADREAFNRAGINYMPLLNDLKFELIEPQNGRDYILVTSSQPIREPFLNFLLELRWASGRIYREYTVLLDPPLYDPQQGRVTADSGTSATPARASGSDATPKYSHTVVRPDAPRARPTYSGGDYGPVQQGDTLWSIANDMRPASVTTHQMMLALLRANPEAFIGNNINELKRGAILQMPSQAEMNAMSPAEALAQVKRQHGLWDDARQAVAESPTQRASSAGASVDSGAAVDAGTDAAGSTESRLELVAAAEGDATQQSGATTGADPALSQKLAVANEKLESLSQENAELKDRLAENEALIDDLKRLIALKDDELAAMQKQVAGDAAGVEAGTPAADSSLMVPGVNYPNGDPAQFITGNPDARGVAPAPSSSTEQPVYNRFEHTVNYPDATAGEQQTAAAEDNQAEQPVTAEQPAAETQAAEPPAKTAAREAAGASTGGGIMDSVMGLLGTARNYIMQNLMLVGGALLALIVLLAGAAAVRRRSEAAAEQEAEAAMAAGVFPDFTSDSDLEQTSFEDDSESVTALHAFDDSDTNDEAATEVGAATATGSVATDDDDDEADDLFVVPEGEAEPLTTADEDEDPLAEVNVLMAYEHFDQAESFVRNKLKSEPDNVEYHAKLLEVFYSAGNKKKYEEAASDLRDLTGGQGEHWDMAVAMWRELSPNRALFEGAEEEESPLESTGGGGGIVDITSDTAGETIQGEGTGGGLDFDLGDSTGAGSENDDSGDVLDLTASDQESDDDILDLTAASGEDDNSDMLDLTSTSSGTEAPLDDTQTLSRGSDEDDNSLDFSLGEAGGSDLLDVTQTGNLEDSEDLLDVTGSGSKAPASDDNSFDFSLDMDSESETEMQTGTAVEQSNDDDNLVEFDSSGFDLEPGSDEAEQEDKTSAGTETDDDALTLGAESNGDLDLEIEDESADSGDLDEIGAELDRLEQTLGTLTRGEATRSFGSNTSDALDGIDEALESVDSEAASEGDGSDSSGDDELDISLEGLSDSEDDGSSAFGIELDSGDDEDTKSGSGDASSEELSEFSLDLDSDDESDTGTLDSASEDDISAELEELSKQLDSGALELDEDSDESGLDSGADEALSMDFDLDTGTESASGYSSEDLDISLDGTGQEDSGEDSATDTVKMDAVSSASDEDDLSFSSDLDLDLSGDSFNASTDIDMDSTVELPKERLSSGLSFDTGETDDEDDDNTLFVARSGDNDEQSLEDELTTKLDLAKAYVELGDADSARNILQEVLQDGNDEQKRQAEELLSQI